MSTKDKPGKKGDVRHHMSATKLWIFRLCALFLIPALLLCGLEAGLRLTGYGYSSEALTVRTISGEAICCPNPHFTKRFFPADIARSFERSLIFPKEKDAGTFRIFVLGGSAARGTPKPKYNFGRLLQAMLRDMYPDLRFEVHNAAIVAINSHVVREIAEDCAAFDPDLMIVYLGNNEVVGPYGPGTILTGAPASLPMIRSSIALKSTRTGQLIHQALRNMLPSSQTPKKWNGMEMFLDKQVRSGTKDLNAAYRHFEKNLQDICRSARRAGIPVIVSTVGANQKDCPPFASLHKETLSPAERQAWDARYREGIDAEANGHYARAATSYRAALDIDPEYADLQYRLGRCWMETGDHERARTHYQLALQYDTLRFRADTQINNVIRSVAEGRESEGIYLVDSEAAFAQASPHQLPGKELFFEHVHLNFAGNYVLARALFPAVQQQLPSDARSVSDRVLSKNMTARSIGYNSKEQHDELHTIYGMLTKPPFTNQLFHENRMAALQKRITDLEQTIDLKACLALYDQALKAHPEDWRLMVERYNLSLEVEGMKDLAQREATLRNILQRCHYIPIYMALADILTIEGKLQQAEQTYQDALQINPDMADAYFLMARLAAQRGDQKAIIEYVQTGLRIGRPETVAPYGILADTYDKKGAPNKAIRVLRQGLEDFTGAQTAILHYHLASLLHKTGDQQAALEHMDKALQLNPAYGQQQAFRIKYSSIRGY